MRDGLFKQYITTFGLTLFTCTLVLGIALLYFSAKNYTEEKREALVSASERAVTIAGEGIVVTPSAIVINTSVTEGFTVIYDTTGVTTFFTNATGRVIACSEGLACTHTTRVNERISDVIIKRGSYFDARYFEGFFQHRGEYTYGVPLRQDNEIVGYIFVSLPITPLFSYLSDMMLTFLISAGTMLLVAAVFIYFATKRLVRPLHEITSAAKAFGTGNFEARVTVTGTDELGRLAQSFNTMADSLSEFESMRRSFVANVSHELRTPMTTIGGYIDGILDSTIPPEKEGYYLSVVSDEVKRLSRLTSSLLDITRIEEGAYEVNTVTINVWKVILSVMGNAEGRISEKNIHIPDLNAAPKFAVCDQDMLYQIFYNLIDNAIKFTPEGGTITVTVTGTAEHVFIVVRNTGMGIKADELTHIFERFYKTDKSRGLDRAGTGLGLYIAKTLSQKMGGDLSVSSKYCEYAQFTITLKAGVVDKRAKQADSDSKKNGKPSKSEDSGKSWFKKKSKNSKSLS